MSDNIYYTPADVEAFCDNLKRSMLDCLERRIDICFHKKNYCDPIHNNAGIAVDFIFQGSTFTISTGVAAAKQRHKHERRSGR